MSDGFVIWLYVASFMMPFLVLVGSTVLSSVIPYATNGKYRFDISYKNYDKLLNGVLVTTTATGSSLIFGMLSGFISTMYFDLPDGKTNIVFFTSLLTVYVIIALLAVSRKLFGGNIL